MEIVPNFLFTKDKIAFQQLEGFGKFARFAFSQKMSSKTQFQRAWTMIEMKEEKEEERKSDKKYEFG